MKLETYLRKHLSESSTKIYLFEIKHFIRHLGEVKAEEATYKEIMIYVSWLRDNYDNGGTIHRIIQAIKQYFFFLIEIGIRQDHPCRHLSIKDQSRGDIQIQDLLKENELELLLEREERYELLKIRNQVVISLLIYQALSTKEITRLTLADIDLKAGKIKIKSSYKTNGRTLHLKAKQILILYKYIEEVRPQLEKANTKTTSLILTKLGTAEKGEGIHYLIESSRPMFPNKILTPTRIRQSVIANLLSAGHDLRLVQVFAGHKNPGATEKYRQTNLEQLKYSVNKHHPLS